jgi:hypothetical protein
MAIVMATGVTIALGALVLTGAHRAVALPAAVAEPA